jgi:hypothetical protein
MYRLGRFSGHWVVRELAKAFDHRNSRSLWQLQFHLFRPSVIRCISFDCAACFDEDDEMFL